MFMRRYTEVKNSVFVLEGFVFAIHDALHDMKFRIEFHEREVLQARRRATDIHMRQSMEA